MQPYAEVEGAIQGFGSPLAFWPFVSGRPGGGGVQRKKKQKVVKKLRIAHAFPQIHEPPYPPFIIVLIARNPSGRIAASKNLKNHTYAKMGAPQRPFLFFKHESSSIGYLLLLHYLHPEP